MAEISRDGMTGHISSSIDPDKTGVSTNKIRPTGRQVVLKVDPLPEKSEGGIYLALDKRGVDHEYGTVISIGPGDFALKTGVRMPLDVRPGDKVVFGRYCGADFEYEGDKYKILPEEQIYCVIEEEETTTFNEVHNTYKFFLIAAGITCVKIDMNKAVSLSTGVILEVEPEEEVIDLGNIPLYKN